MNNTDVIKFYPYKLFKQNQQEYLFASRTGGLYLIDEKVLTLLKLEGHTYEELYTWIKDNPNLGSIEEYEDAIQTFEKLNIVKTETTEDYFKSISDLDCKFSCIELLVVQDCNLRCKYCYGGDGEYNDKGMMSVETAKEAVSYLMHNSKKNKVSVVFFGGEPLINFNLIKEMVDYSKKLADENNKIVKFSMTTNATLLDEEMSNFLKSNNFTITVSIDGNKEIHDANRYYSGNRGSYDDVIKGIDKLKQSKVMTVARASAEPKNMDMLKTAEHLRNEIGFGSIYMSPCINMFEENDHFQLLKNEYDKLLNKLNICLEQKNYRELASIRNLSKWLKRVHRGSIRNTFCGAMTNMIAVDKNGYLYPCHRFVSNKEYVIGNVRKGIDMDSYNNLAKKELALSAREDCCDCWAASLCGGGCPNENLLANGIPNKPIEQYCDVNKYFIENMISRYLKLENEEKEEIFANL